MPLTDEDVAIHAISSFTSPSQKLLDTKAKIDHILASEDPFIDIHELFELYDVLYFRSLLLSRVEVSWSSRLTLCAGKSTDLAAMCSILYCMNAFTHTSLSQHLGSIHVAMMAQVMRTHIWQCDGPCKSQPPFFGLVKRNMNRPPGKSDTWWIKHVQECGGIFTKIAEPEMTKEQVGKLSGMKRAGLQKNKIDSWLSKSDPAADPKAKRRLSLASSEESHQRARQQQASCPICEDSVAVDKINAHLDAMHPP
ncbi:uncharacterized protein MYCFIDRAFT_80758 [Pseudocercospora fijiensis CIRAD86]|uniref:Spartan-like zinc binding domain-containing protein n=1 Tax=Pseudocercospora fijiensis (strain CIRAD86) TaxID=383855 RepID=M2YKT4_PSEFD|nr:uncharacterized protein MYCFIDRAFT_80758 [Pseudocercospora fijiensis CIRAD86]EME78335.1 hypothetical protein MYCFIDRAFT_80758 [Pseudocercospora fijiensis CIRAD86]